MSANKKIVVGEIGQEGTEIAEISSVDSVIQITLTSGLSFDHSIDDPVFLLKYDQYEVSSASSLTGSKSVLGTNDIEVDDYVSEFDASVGSSNYVFIRYKDSIGGTFSNYSDGVLASGYVQSSVQFILNQIRLRANLGDGNEIATDQDLVDFANDALEDLESKRKNWSFLQKTGRFDLTAGIQTYTPPTDLADPDSIEAFRKAGDSNRFRYMDKQEFDRKMREIPKTLVRSTASSGAISITVYDTSAFGASGTLTVNGLTGVSYSGKTAITFTGVSGVSTTLGVNKEIFRSSDLEEPIRFSWWGEKLLVEPAPDKRYSVELDYHSTFTRVDSANDITVIPNATTIIYYVLSIVWALKGDENKSNKFLALYEAKSGRMVAKDRGMQRIQFTPSRKYSARNMRRRRLEEEERIIGN